jgi:hypothetical protein
MSPGWGAGWTELLLRKPFPKRPPFGLMLVSGMARTYGPNPCVYIMDRFDLKFAFGNASFDGFLNKPDIPFIAKGLFGPDNGFNNGFELVMAEFADIPMGQVVIVASGNRGFNRIFAHITGKGLHVKLL